MKTLGIIPARKGSLRFPNKHHALLLGRPIFAYTIDAALESQLLDRIVVSSDDLDLKPLVESNDIEFIQRPAELATATAALDDAVRHVCRLLSERDGFQPDLVITMQGNVPVRKEGQIDEVIRGFEKLPDATAICTAQNVRLRPEWAKVIIDEETAEAAPYLAGYTGYRTQDYPRIYLVDGAIYGVRATTLWAEEGKTAAHSWLGQHLHLVIQDHEMYSLEVDYPDQIALAEFYVLRNRYGDQLHEILSDSFLPRVSRKEG